MAHPMERFHIELIESRASCPPIDGCSASHPWPLSELSTVNPVIRPFSLSENHDYTPVAFSDGEA
jgi:hypothetical protein